VAKLSACIGFPQEGQALKNLLLSGFCKARTLAKVSSVNAIELLSLKPNVILAGNFANVRSGAKRNKHNPHRFCSDR
jgi:hypothetical protein